jgi:hypothetical protein
MQLWPDPLDEIDPSEAPWNWVEVSRVYDGPTKNPPNNLPGWERWYFTMNVLMDLASGSVQIVIL